MGTEPKVDQNVSSPQPQAEPSVSGGGHGDDGSSHQGGGFAASDTLASITPDDGNQAAVTATLSADGNGTGDVLGDNDLLGAVTAMSPDAVSNLDHTLDHLITSTDLFDVPALDFHDVLPT
jgi:hypothetical protein